MQHATERSSFAGADCLNCSINFRKTWFKFELLHHDRYEL
ncbi:uncharacterized protein Dmoj_GI25638 [Drosophila mojavensis]|uniref:Uncharacterized protein n=1 Tax=Drosophila mojavensis TaxID=7230 RepID=A0A0Q9X696_DROMO|nr:uncharacterized protein Dmoj_GI25638 [Drosophila mojavensis]